ncbi:MAG: ATP-binding cassette domain-containing protein [Rhodospirillales bacterium]
MSLSSPSTDNRLARDRAGAFSSCLSTAWAAALGFGLVTALVGLAVPLYSLQVFDRVLTSRSEETLIFLTLGVLLALAMVGALDTIRNRISQRLALRVAILGDRLNLPPAESRDLIVPLRRFLATSVLALGDSVLAPLFVVLIFLLHPWLGGLCLIAGLVLFMNGRAAVMARTEPMATNGLLAAEDTPGGPALRRVLGLDREWERRKASAQDRDLRAEQLVAEKAGAGRAIGRTLRLVAQISVTGLGAYLVLKGQLSLGAMVAASILSLRAITPMEGLARDLRSRKDALAAVARLDARLDALAAPSSLPMPARQSGEPPRPIGGELTVDGLIVLAPTDRRPLLKGIAFTFGPGIDGQGGALGVTGPLGSGKSALLRVLAGADVASSGRCLFGGVDIAALGPGTIGFLPGEDVFLPGTVAENIARFDNGASQEDLTAACTNAGVSSVIRSLPKGFETPIDGRGLPLSAGQRRAIALARAFYGQPALVVLDDPVAGLDAETTLAVEAAIRRATTSGTLLVVSAQRRALLAALDQVLVLSGGLIERRITPPAAPHAKPADEAERDQAEPDQTLTEGPVTAPVVEVSQAPQVLPTEAKPAKPQKRKAVIRRKSQGAQSPTDAKDRRGRSA